MLLLILFLGLLVLGGAVVLGLRHGFWAPGAVFFCAPGVQKFEICAPGAKTLESSESSESQESSESRKPKESRESRDSLDSRLKIKDSLTNTKDSAFGAQSSATPTLCAETALHPAHDLVGAGFDGLVRHVDERIPRLAANFFHKFQLIVEHVWVGVIRWTTGSQAVLALLPESQQLSGSDFQAENPLPVQPRKRLRNSQLWHQRDIGDFPAQDGQVQAERCFAYP